MSEDKTVEKTTKKTTTKPVKEEVKSAKEAPKATKTTTKAKSSTKPATPNTPKASEVPKAPKKPAPKAAKAKTPPKTPKPTKTPSSEEEGLKIRIRLKAYDHRLIDQSAKQIVDTALRTGATVSGPVPLPTNRSTFTVNKSPHIFKAGGETFEMKVHKRLIDVSHASPKTIESLQNLALPSGVDPEIKM